MKLNKNGFSMLEVMIVVVILGILVMTAVPNLQVWAASQRLTSDVAQLEGDIQVARIMAINRGTPVTVRFNSPGVNQYTIFIDDGQGGGTARDLVQNGSEQTISQTTLASGVTFNTLSFAGGGVLFNARGLRGRPVTDPANLVLENENGKQYQLFVTLMGDVNASKL